MLFSLLLIHSDFVKMISNKELLEVKETAQILARDLNSYDSLGIHLHSREEGDVDALRISNSKLFYNSDGQPVVGFPWIDDISPNQGELGSNFGLVKGRFDAVMKSLGNYPVCSLRHLEFSISFVKDPEPKIINVRSRVQRKAAIEAQEKNLAIHLISKNLL